MDAPTIAAALDGAALVYFDGRLTEAALLLARAARAAGVPVLVEGERLRPGLEGLLAEADYVVTSAHFPQVRAGPKKAPKKGGNPRHGGARGWPAASRAPAGAARGLKGRGL
jgi:hypothetical protein